MRPKDRSGAVPLASIVDIPGIGKMHGPFRWLG